LAVGFRPWSELSVPFTSSSSVRGRRTTSLSNHTECCALPMPWAMLRGRLTVCRARGN
jgi:hypothetical protein